MNPSLRMSHAMASCPGRKDLCRRCCARLVVAPMTFETFRQCRCVPVYLSLVVGSSEDSSRNNLPLIYPVQPRQLPFYPLLSMVVVITPTWRGRRFPRPLDAPQADPQIWIILIQALDHQCKHRARPVHSSIFEENEGGRLSGFQEGG